LDPFILLDLLAILTLVWVVPAEIAIVFIVYGLRKTSARIAPFTDRFTEFLSKLTPEQMDAMFARLSRWAEAVKDSEARRKEAGVD
jgi:hypothetical protein